MTLGPGLRDIFTRTIFFCMSRLLKFGRTEFRSLLRCLLREASYLPDGPARLFTKRRVLSRFRFDGSPTAELASLYGAEKSNVQSRQSDSQHQLWHEGIKFLRQLQRANQGFNQDLTNVLLSTYGRQDERRWHLLQPFIELDHNQENKIDVISKQLSKFPRFPQKDLQKLPRPDPKLLTLLNSQKIGKVRWLPNAKVSNLRLEVPEKNSWLRPTPVKRVVNIVKRWYKEKLEQALPPLPSAEWRRLERLAQGQDSWDGPVKRRTPCKSSLFSSQTLRDRMDNTMPLLAQQLRQVKIQDNGGKEQPHAITDRYMQRLYAKIFQSAADMRWNDTTNSWIFRWGQATPARRTLPKNLRDLKS